MKDFTMRFLISYLLETTPTEAEKNFADIMLFHSSNWKLKRGEKAAKEKEESEIKDRIGRSSAEYDETIEELTNRENRLRNIANN